VDIVEAIAGVKLKRVYNLAAPTGVRGRNSDNRLIAERLGWAPGISLEAGLVTAMAFILTERGIVGVTIGRWVYIDDCITGTRKIFDSDECEPLNLGSDRSP
jgi:hypothetical protein